MVSCPVPGHEDKNPSCEIFDKAGGAGLGIKCYGGCPQKATWQALTDLGYVEKKKERDTVTKDQCQTVSKTWVYNTAGGEEHLKATKTEYFRPDGTRKCKSFIQIGPRGGSPGPSYPVVPLYLPAVLAKAKDNGVIFDVEGEGCADALREGGLVATTSNGGSSNKKGWETSQYWQYFNGCDFVVILADNDVPGIEFALFKGKLFHQHGIKCKVVMLPDLGKPRRSAGLDVKDWLEKGHTIDELKAIAKEEEFFAPSEFEGDESASSGPTLSPSHMFLTEAFNAKHFLDHHGDDFVFIPELNKGMFAVYEETGKGGGRFKLDRAEKIMRLAEEANAKLAEAYQVVDLDAKEKQRWLKASQNASTIKNTLVLARNKRVAHADELDQQPDLLNTPSGVVHLPTMELREHSRSYRMMKMTPVGFNLNAQCPRYIEFLKRTYDGNMELITFDQEHFGSCMTGHTRDQVIRINRGSGANGKSVQTGLQLRCLGIDYSMSVPAAVFKDIGDGNDNASNNFHQLHGLRFGVILEIKKGMKLDDQKLKEITDGSPISARANYGETYNYMPTVSIVMNGNYTPNVTMDDSIKRRLRYVPYDCVIPEDERNPMLEAELWEAEAEGIFAWYLQGAAQWYGHGKLQVPKAVKDFSTALWDEADVVKQFVAGWCRVLEEKDAEARTLESALHKAYSAFMHRQGFKNCLSPTSFKNELGRLGFNKKRWTKGEEPKFLLVKAEYQNATANESDF